jgi:hypothetical protein
MSSYIKEDDFWKDTSYKERDFSMIIAELTAAHSIKFKLEEEHSVP